MTMARAARRLGRLLLALVLFVAGAAMLVLPGPGILTIALSIGMLGRALGWERVIRLEQRIVNAVQGWSDRLFAAPVGAYSRQG